MTCRACRKITPKDKQWVSPEGDRFCSRPCFDVYRQGKIMTDPTPFEQAAMEFAGDRAGEHLEELGKTDLAKLTAEEWATFINVVCTGYIDKIQQEMGRLEANLDYLRKRHEPLPGEPIPA